MSSTLVLARKYRPRNFSELIGQPHVVQALSNALSLRRLHHAYLFTGTRGVGKTTISRIMAKSLNCVGPDGQGGITAQPCGVCEVCRDVDAGRFIDYVELDAASNRGVDEISQLLEQSAYKPVQGRFKVFMIDEVHMLSTTAFNAMLKTLEEPPEYLKFILATTDPQKIPVTVLSRCLQFNLRPVNTQDVQAHLSKVLEQEQIQAQPGALRLLAKAARGSMRDGLSLTDQAIAFGAGQITEDIVRQMIGAVDRSGVLRILQALAAHDGAQLLARVDELRAQGISAAMVLEEFALVLHRLALVQQVTSVFDEDEDAAALGQLAADFAADELQLFYSLALQGRSEISLAPDEYVGLSMVLLRMLAFRLDYPAQRAAADAEPPLSAQVPARAAATRPAAAGAIAQSATAPAVATAQPVGQATVTPTAATQVLNDASTEAAQTCQLQWLALIQDLISKGSLTAMVKELALKAQCVAMVPVYQASMGAQDVCAVTLHVELANLRSDANRTRLEALLQQAFVCQFRLELVNGPVRDSWAIRETMAQQARQSAAESLIHSDPELSSLLQQFKGAQIVPGSIKPIA